MAKVTIYATCLVLKKKNYPKVTIWTPNKTHAVENCCWQSRIWSENCYRRLEGGVQKYLLMKWWVLSMVKCNFGKYTSRKYNFRKCNFGKIHFQKIQFWKIHLAPVFQLCKYCWYFVVICKRDKKSNQTIRSKHYSHIRLFIPQGY